MSVNISSQYIFIERILYCLRPRYIRYYTFKYVIAYIQFFSYSVHISFIAFGFCVQFHEKTVVKCVRMKRKKF